MKSHKELLVWQKSMDFVQKIYQITSSFPSNESFGLQSQLRRAAVSIPCNIAEGAARNTTKEFIRFLSIALGSASEIETQIEIAKRLRYINSIPEKELIEIRTLLILLSRKLKIKENSKP